MLRSKPESALRADLPRPVLRPDAVYLPADQNACSAMLGGSAVCAGRVPQGSP
jgi:hypothetical protein